MSWIIPSIILLGSVVVLTVGATATILLCRYCRLPEVIVVPDAPEPKPHPPLPVILPPKEHVPVLSAIHSSPSTLALGPYPVQQEQMPHPHPPPVTVALPTQPFPVKTMMPPQIYLRTNRQVLNRPPSPASPARSARAQCLPSLSLSTPKLLHEAQRGHQSREHLDAATIIPLRRSGQSSHPPGPPGSSGPSIQQDWQLQLRRKPLPQELIQPSVALSGPLGEGRDVLLFLRQPPVHPGLPLTHPLPHSLVTPGVPVAEAVWSQLAGCASRERGAELAQERTEKAVQHDGIGPTTSQSQSYHIFCEFSEVSQMLRKMQQADMFPIRRHPPETRSAVLEILETQSLTPCKSSSCVGLQPRCPPVQSLFVSIGKLNPAPFTEVPHLVIRILSAQIPQPSPEVCFSPAEPTMRRLQVEPPRTVLEAVQGTQQFPRAVLRAPVLPLPGRSGPTRYILPEVYVLDDPVPHSLVPRSIALPDSDLSSFLSFPDLGIRITETVLAHPLWGSGPTPSFNPFMPRIGRREVEPQGLSFGAFCRRLEEPNTFPPRRDLETSSAVVPEMLSVSTTPRRSFFYAGHQQLCPAVKEQLTHSMGRPCPERLTALPRLVIPIKSYAGVPMPISTLLFNPHAPRIGRIAIAVEGKGFGTSCMAERRQAPETRATPALETQRLTPRRSSSRSGHRQLCPPVQHVGCIMAKQPQNPELLAALPSLVIRTIPGARLPRCPAPAVGFNPNAPRIGRIWILPPRTDLEALQQGAPKIPRATLRAAVLPLPQASRPGRHRHLWLSVEGLTCPTSQDRCLKETSMSTKWMDLTPPFEWRRLKHDATFERSRSILPGPLKAARAKVPLKSPLPSWTWQLPILQPQLPFSTQSAVLPRCPSTRSSKQNLNCPPLRLVDSNPQKPINHPGSQILCLMVEVPCLVPKTPASRHTMGLYCPQYPAHYPALRRYRIQIQPTRSDGSAFSLAFRIPRETQRTPVLPIPSPTPLQWVFYYPEPVPQVIIHPTPPCPNLQSETPSTVAFLSSPRPPVHPPVDVLELSTIQQVQPVQSHYWHEATVPVPMPAPPNGHECSCYEPCRPCGLTSTLGSPWKQKAKATKPKAKDAKDVKATRKDVSPGPGDYDPEHPGIYGRIPGRVPGNPKERRDPNIRI